MQYKFLKKGFEMRNKSGERGFFLYSALASINIKLDTIFIVCGGVKEIFKFDSKEQASIFYKELKTILAFGGYNDHS